MGKTLTEIAQQLKSSSKKVQLIYAFNGVGKTRLSREFKELVAPKNHDSEDEEDLPRNKILYYNAFTEDLFYWDNDLNRDAAPTLKIQPNNFTDWVFKDQGQDQNIITTFQHYTSDKLTPRFNPEYSEINFLLERGNADIPEKLKISKGEESCFIWSIFYTLIEQVIQVLNIPEPEDRESNEFDHLEYVFIDDPVSSLDENHLIDLAVNLAKIITSNESSVKFIITTHNTIFYNIIYNELNAKACYLFERFEDGTYELLEKKGDSNTSFSYHLYIMKIIEQAIEENKVERYHFMLLCNLYEKTASFLGYQKWGELLPDNKQAYLSRITQFTSHSTLSNEAVATPTPQEKNTVKLLLEHLKNTYSFWQQREGE
ncbi:MAG: hypothetical protein PHN64_01925 [Desulfovibrionaceae bacterium]|nr:hypothetical protein [Desulfovibrionaceae bacterium]